MENGVDSSVLDQTTKDEIDKLAKELATEYTSFLQVDNSKQIRSLEESVDANLTILESMCLELESVRTNGTQCLEVVYPQLQEKFAEMKHIYAKIDAMESIVKQVKKTVDAMEVETDRAEKCLDTSSSVKKFFTSIFKPHTISPPGPEPYQFQSPEIFSTDALFPRTKQEVHEEAHEVEESSKFD